MRKPREAPPGSEERLKNLLNAATDIIEIKRIQSVYFRIAYNHSPEEISDMVGYSLDHIRHIQASYWKYGEEALKVKQTGGRIRENLSLEEEKELLSSFNKQAAEGGILEVSRIKDAYEEKLGKKVHKTTVYRMLKRHGWRKIAPRPYHPKNDKEAMTDFKKNFTT